jgi:hypothetical protein
LLIKVFAYLLALRLQAQRVFSKLTMGIRLTRDTLLPQLLAARA